MTTEAEFLAFMKKIPDEKDITIEQWNKLLKESEELDDRAGAMVEEHLMLIKPADKKPTTNHCKAMTRK